MVRVSLYQKASEKPTKMPMFSSRSLRLYIVLLSAAWERKLLKWLVWESSCQSVLKAEKHQCQRRVV